MKRIEKWIQKQEAYVMLYFMCALIALIIGRLTNITLAGLCSVFILPFLMYLLQNVMEKTDESWGRYRYIFYCRFEAE